MLSPSSYRILAVDDVPDNLFLLQTILEAEGYQVDTASDGVTALEKLQQTCPDLVLLDVMMPGMNGYEVAHRIRQIKIQGSVPIVLLTAHGEASVARGLEVGANDFIYKPIDFDHLLNRVMAFLPTKPDYDVSSQLFCPPETEVFSYTRTVRHA